MRKSDYDHIKHCCKKCGNLMPFRDIDNHTDAECLMNEYYRDKRDREAKEWSIRRTNKLETKQTNS
jgi:hypothetical protein